MHLLLIGCGKMGGALLRGWTRHASASSIILIDPVQPAEDILNYAGVSWQSSLASLPQTYEPTAIVLAVKPQQMATVLPLYARFQSSVFLSVAAGQTLGRLKTLLGNDQQAIVRAMPNLPASIGEGMSVAAANAHVSESQRKLCDSLLSACGQVAWVHDETLLDSVTALSGCGPAYVFALAEAMASAGESLGLSSGLAEKLARQTIVGAGALLAQSLEKTSVLRQTVASPGGSTEAALKHLMADNGLAELMHRAMSAAAIRSKELAT